MRTLPAFLTMATLGCTTAHAWDVTQPRGATRSIDFTVEEGTIQSLDVSPDGRWIVFDLLAHVYRVPISGGEAECLTQSSGIALNFDPRYSPDGTHIAFTSDRNGQNGLWTMNADGSEPRLVADGGEYWLTQADWAPDGRSLVATRYLIQRLPSADWTVSSRIWRFPIDGTPGTQLVGPGLTYVVAPTFSPDGKYVYYEDMAQPRMAHDMFLVSDAHHIRRLEIATGESTAVTESDTPRPYGFAAEPQLSPDGKTLAFIRRVPYQRVTYRGKQHNHTTGLWLRDLASGSERLLLSPTHPDHFDTSDGYHLRFAPGYSFDPDGRSIVLTEGGQLRRVNIATGAVATIPFRARVQRTISQMARPRLDIAPERQAVKFVQRPSSSPDGRTVVFDALGKIWRMEWPQGRPRELTPPMPGAFQFAATWSRDGRFISFATWEDGIGGHLWVTPASGGMPKRITRTSAEYLGAEFSEDGASLYAVRGAGAMARGLRVQEDTLYLLEKLSVADGSATVLTHFTSQPVRPQPGPGGRLFFTEEIADYESGDQGPEFNEYQPRIALISLDANGGDRREHARFPFTGRAQISPDGSHVAFHEAGNVLLARLAGAAMAGFKGDGSAPFFDRSHPSESLQWLTRRGGVDARWIAPDRVEYVSGNRYFRQNVATGKVESRDIHLGIADPSARGRIALTGARVLTMGSRGIIDRGDIVIDGGRITCIGDCDLSGITHRLDASGKTIMPGLIDAHAHPGYDGDIVRQHQPQLAIYTAYGVTTILDPSADAERVFPAADLVRAGRIVGPRILSSGPVVIPTGDIRPIRSYEDAEDDVERLASWDAVTIKQYTLRRRDQRQWLVEAARRNGNLMVTSERLNLYYDLGTLMDGQTGWEHPLTEYPIHSDVIRFIAATGANYTPAFQASGQGYYAREYWQARTGLLKDAKFLSYVPWRDLERFADHRQRPFEEYPILFWTETVKDLLDAGGSVSTGAHSQWDGIGVHREAWTFAMAVPPLRALETATSMPARYLGIDRDVGSLEPGKLADLIVLNSNPLDDIRHTTDIACVMQGGVLYDDETLDQLWPRAVPYGPRPWLLPGAPQPAPGKDCPVTQQR